MLAGRDSKLDRDVAFKVLPEAFTSDPDRLARSVGIVTLMSRLGRQPAVPVRVSARLRRNHVHLT